MADSREARANATEKKVLLDAQVGEAVRVWAREHLRADPYGAGPFDDEYLTSSLYFDTEQLDVFRKRGSFGRAKYRIRRYSSADYAFLERKLRKPNLLVKRRTQVGLDVVAALGEGRLPAGSPARWFVDRLAMRRLAPSCLISYHRTARGIATPSGLARLTIDDGLHAVLATGFALPDVPLAGSAMLPGRVILELKFRGALPALFKDLLRTFNLQWQTASKYRLGMMALGHELPADEAQGQIELEMS